MTTIQVFDPAMCCNTGVCGVDVDQSLVTFAADVDWAKQNGAQIERFNLSQQPMAFAAGNAGGWPTGAGGPLSLAGGSGPMGWA